MTFDVVFVSTLRYYGVSPPGGATWPSGQQEGPRSRRRRERSLVGSGSGPRRSPRGGSFIQAAGHMRPGGARGSYLPWVIEQSSAHDACRARRRTDGRPAGGRMDSCGCSPGSALRRAAMRNDRRHGTIDLGFELRVRHSIAKMLARIQRRTVLGGDRTSIAPGASVGRRA